MNSDSHTTCGYSTGTRSSISHGESVMKSASSSECISYTSCYAGTPTRSYAGDPSSVARWIFRDEVRDALVVLKNVGALGCAAEREWCIRELQRLLLELFTADLA
jgi:hypothetical protein